MGILTWIGFGLVAGILARMLFPGPNPAGLIRTTLLGVGGGLIGGFVGTAVGWGDVTGFDLRSFGLAIAGALALLVLFPGKRR